MLLFSPTTDIFKGIKWCFIVNAIYIYFFLKKKKAPFKIFIDVKGIDCINFAKNNFDNNIFLSFHYCEGFYRCINQLFLTFLVYLIFSHVICFIGSEFSYMLKFAVLVSIKYNLQMGC